MKLLLTGDWQVSPKNLDRCHAALNHLLSCIDTYKVDTVGLLGDMKDAFNPVDQRVTNFLLSMGQRIVNRVPAFALEGNHDRVAIADGSETGLPVFAAADLIIVDAPKLIIFSPKTPAWCVPFSRDSQRMEAAIQEGIGKAPILFFHNDVIGSVGSAGRKSPTGINPKLLTKFKACIGGHIHLQQQVTDNIWFIGSPFCHDWGEVNQRKGYLLLDTDTFKVTSIYTPFPTWYDPSLPGYKPERWNGVHVRIHLPRDPKQAEVIKQRSLKEYGSTAIIHYDSLPGTAASNIALEHTSDPELIQQYLKQNPVWPNACQLEAYLEYKMADIGTGLRGLRGAQFLEVNATNVLCFESVKILFNRLGVTLVTAVNQDWGGGRSNGGGKTSYLQLLLILLFGRTAKGQEHDHWARQGTKAPAVIQGSVRLADGRTLTITRGRHPGRIEAALDGVSVGAGDARGVQKAITDYIGISWEVLTSSLYVGQAEASTLLLGTDKERKELFNQFLGLERFQIAVERVSIDVKVTKRVLGEIEQQSLELCHDLEEKKKTVDRLTQEHEEKRKKAAEIAVWKTQLALDKDKAKVAAAKLIPLKTGHTEASGLWQHAFHESATLTERLRNLQTTLASTQQNRVCPTCKRPLPKNNKVSTNHLQKEIGDAASQLIIAKGKVESMGLRRSGLERRIQELITEQTTAQSSTQSLQARIEEASAVIAIAHNPLLDAQSEMTVLVQRAGACKMYLEYLREHLEFLQAALQVVGRNGLPAFLCTLVCPQLNEAADEFSNAFAEAGIRVVFHGAEGEVDVRVENPHGGDGVEDQSAGEMRIASLVTSFAMRSVLAPFGLIILDEPGEGLDAVNAGIFAKGLSQVAQRFGCVFVTTHNGYILESLDYNYWVELVKQNRITTAFERG